MPMLLRAGGIDATRLAANVAREHGLRLTGDVPQRLALSPGDRAILAARVENWRPYLDAAPDRPRTPMARHLIRSAPTSGDSDLSDAITAVVDGRVGDIGTELARPGKASACR